MKRHTILAGGIWLLAFVLGWISGVISLAWLIRQVGAPKWTIRNYNTFIRESRSEYDLSLAEARDFYREVRDWKVGPAYGADVDRYKDALYDDPGLVVDSMLYGWEVFEPTEPPIYAPPDYLDDFMLDSGAELELTAETYKANGDE